MIDTLFIALHNGYAYIRKHPQLLFTVLLVLFIPLAFLLSGQQFLNAARLNQETVERERIGLLHDAVAASFTLSSFDSSEAQRFFSVIAAQNSDITTFSLITKDDSGARIVAGTPSELVGTFIEDQSLLEAAHIRSGTSIILPRISDGVRYWQAVRHLEFNGASYYVFTETSLAHIDALFAKRIQTAYLWLFGILVVVLLLVLRHVRLIDYAYLYRETKRANEMKDLFTNMIAHELRAPLTAMRGYASMITENATVPADARRAAEHVEQAAGRLVLVVSDLLDVARIHSGKLSIKIERTDVTAVISSVVEVMRPIAAEKYIAIQTSAHAPMHAALDEKRLYQALTNLVSNAIKYTKSGSIDVALEEKSDRIEIRVKDTGIGLSAESQKHLFAPFYRAEQAETAGVVGTGLGMWITKQLIELMRGSIAVESIKGVGTHVVITLPKS